jgi:acetyl esterase/lipase
VVFVHGGYWRPFDRRLFQPFTGLHGCVGVALANRGIATAVVSYRQFRDATSIQDPLDDIAHATRWVIDQIASEGGDPSRVYIVGHSAGGFMTSLLAVEPEHLQRAGVAPGRVRGFVSLAGVYDLQRLADGIGSSLAPVVRASAPTPEAIERYSPIRHVQPDHPPMLLGIGDDEAVTRNEYSRMLAALSANGGAVHGFEVPGESHMDLVMHLSRPGNRVLAEIVRFIDEHR